MPLVSARQVTRATADAYAARAEKIRWRADPVGWAEHNGLELWSGQREILRAVADHDRVAVRSCHSSGKALALDTPLPTPTGWTTMGEVQPGDMLYDEQGKPTTVLSCSEIQRRDTYRVTFGDGSSLIATDDHRWAVIDLKVRHALRVRRANHTQPAPTDWRDHWSLAEVRTTAELAGALRLGGQLRWGVPNCRPLEGAAVDLPVPPYTLGFWLGDGTSVHGSATIGHGDADEVLAQVRAEGVQVREQPSQRRAGCSGYCFRGIRGGLVRLGVLGNKHVPDMVLRADEATRLAVLQGFMDADGGASNGSAETCVTNERLADGIAELVISLGWKAHRQQRPARLYGRDCGTRYYIRFRPDRPVFRLTRKVDATRPPGGHRSRPTTRTIAAIEQIPTVLARCIAVDSPSHLYLAGRQMVPTHNTFCAAVLTGWWLNIWPVGTARVVTTAPTSAQIRGQLWPEIGGLWTQVPDLPGRVNQTEIWVGKWLAGVGRKSSDHTPASMQGWHAQNLLVIIDEADGISPSLWGTIDTLASAAGNKVVGIGNPDDPQSEFRQRQADQGHGGQYHTIRISAWDTPNFSGEPVSDLLRSVLLAPSWVEEMRRAWGGPQIAPDGIPDHPFWASKVEAEYPDETANTVIRVSDLARARRSERVGALMARDQRMPTTVGIDVAGSETGDESIVRGRRGLRLLDQTTIRTGDPEQLEDWLMAQVDVFGARQVNLDADGLGFGYVSAIRRCRPQTAVTEVRSAVAASNSTAYANRRAEMWWTLREALMASGDEQLDFTRLDDATAAQLLAPRWEKPRGRLLVESKDDLRKRLGRSPDNADALVYAFARPVAGGVVRVGRARGSAAFGAAVRR